MQDSQSTRARSESLRPDQVQPLDLKIRKQESELRVTWADGSTSTYPLAYLRKKCPCAACRQAQEKNHPLLPVLSKPASGSITVTSAELVGNYALQIVWSDGHNTGIYDYRYLRSIDPMVPSA